MITETDFLNLIKRNKVNKHILESFVSLEIKDAWLVSGSLFQTVWNLQTNNDPLFGIKDYDIFYFDDSDLSWEAEDEVIKKVNDHFSDLEVTIEIRNQARVHLWYPEKFNISYPPLSKATDGIDRFLAQACMVGINLKTHEVYAPYGFEDLVRLIIRPNDCENFKTEPYLEKSNAWLRKWPQLKIIQP